MHFARATGPVVPGTILHLDGETWDEAGGGGGVAARALPGLGASPARFYTALGDDDAARAAERVLTDDGVDVCAARFPGPQNRVLGVLEPDGERTLFILGPEQASHARRSASVGRPRELRRRVLHRRGSADAVAARRARVLVVTARRLGSLIESGVRADVLIGSGTDPGEQFRDDDLPVRPHVIVRTEGAAGGGYRTDRGEVGRYPAAPLPGPRADTYGAGDVMMAALTLELGAGRALEEALARAATAAAAQLTRRGATPGAA